VLTAATRSQQQRERRRQQWQQRWRQQWQRQRQALVLTASLAVPLPVSSTLDDLTAARGKG